VPAVETLPRFQQVWSRDGLGSFEGTVADGVYYTLTNDRRLLHAIDVRTGQTRWQAGVSVPIGENIKIGVATDVVVLAHQKRDSAEAVVASLSARDGASLWTLRVDCPQVGLDTAGTRLYLGCGSFRPPRREARELDRATGKEVARVPVAGAYGFTPDGICGMSDSETWCGRLAGRRIERRWTQPGGTSQFYFRLAGEFIVQFGKGQVVVRRTRDGELLWQGPATGGVQAIEKPPRLVVKREGRTEVLGLEDGARIASIPAAGATYALSDGERLLFAAYREPLAYLLDGRAPPQAITDSPPFIHGASRGVVLSHVGSEAAPLEGYSLTSFAPPQTTLDPYHQVVAVLERHPFSYQAHQALVPLRKIPDHVESLAQVLRSGPPALLETTLAVAGLIGDARLLPPIRDRLEALKAPPEGNAGGMLLFETLTALSQLDSPQAPTILLGFWNRVGTKIPRSRRRTMVAGIVADSVWKYGARKEWEACPDTTFTVGGGVPDQVLLGTKSPGLPQAVDAQRRWAVVCEARADDSGDGKIAVSVGQHGDTHGDQLMPYLVLGAGAGTEIDDFVTADPTGRHAVVTRGLCVYLVDLESGKASALPRADGRPGDAVGGAHRAASFSADGERLLYLRSDGRHSEVIQRELRTGQERSIDPGPGELSQAFFDDSGRFVVMEVVASDTSGDGLVRPPRLATTLGPRRCRGPVLSASFFGQSDDRPTQIVAPVTGGRPSAAAARATYQPSIPTEPGYQLVPSAGAELTPRAALPRGPFRWQVRRADR
jgi:hypothetical protein